MMRLHLFLSVEYGVGVAQQLFITTLNLKREIDEVGSEILKL